MWVPAACPVSRSLLSECLLWLEQTLQALHQHVLGERWNIFRLTVDCVFQLRLGKPKQILQDLVFCASGVSTHSSPLRLDLGIWSRTSLESSPAVSSGGSSFPICSLGLVILTLALSRIERERLVHTSIHQIAIPFPPIAMGRHSFAGKN